MYFWLIVAGLIYLIAYLAHKYLQGPVDYSGDHPDPRTYRISHSGSSSIKPNGLGKYEKVQDSIRRAASHRISED